MTSFLSLRNERTFWIAGSTVGDILEKMEPTTIWYKFHQIYFLQRKELKIKFVWILWFRRIIAHNSLDFVGISNDADDDFLVVFFWCQWQKLKCFFSFLRNFSVFWYEKIPQCAIKVSAG